MKFNISVYYSWNNTLHMSFIQFQFRKIKIEFQKIQLLFSNFKKQFLNFQLQTVEYSDTRI